MVDDFGLLHFTPLAVEDKHSMRLLLGHIDKANGYAFTGLPGTEGGYSAQHAASAAPGAWPHRLQRLLQVLALSF